MSIQNIALGFYKFVQLNQLETLRSTLLNRANELSIKGKIIIAEEGINGMLSGSQLSIKEYKDFLCQIDEFSDLEFKENLYPKDEHLFGRMLIKIKDQIITLRQDVDPVNNTGNYLAPLDFLKWQEDQEDFLIVDTRNTYEVNLGTFRNAIDPKIESFDEFPQWVDTCLKDQKDKKIVTFCTGGIRCEKATAYMKAAGFKDVYQIKGGIINYLEKTKDKDSNYWEGECVVFDKRKAVNSKLEPTHKSMCYVCLCELTPDNTQSFKTDTDQACKSCETKMHEAHQKRLKRGQARHEFNLMKRATLLKEEREKYQQSL